jgi:nicotinate-nucleotide--dimethylbenzimidazole phosphoribosyltransferase
MRMKLELTECGTMVLSNQPSPIELNNNHQVLKVLACAVCRTDAKMWRQGHRDLALPRVLGHEIAAVDEANGQVYTVWPGQNCGTCKYCMAGRENLCDNMKIIGFHADGGFASHISVPKKSLIPVNSELAPLYITFTEPVACIINSLSRFTVTEGERAVVFGGGVLGMLAALVLLERGCQVTVIEKSQEKISNLSTFCSEQGIELCKETTDGDFDIAINCCDSHIAFSLCITKLRKGGRLSFFSGLQKNKELDTGLVNIIHYKELELSGSYGPLRHHMVLALEFLEQNFTKLDSLIEGIIELSEVEEVLPRILSGEALKYIVDFEHDGRSLQTPVDVESKTDSESYGDQLDSYPELKELVERIKKPGGKIKDLAQKKVDLKTKPLGALGTLEKLAVQLSVIQKSLTPEIKRKQMLVFAGDHGVVEEGVSAFPAKVTQQMVENFLNGGAAINCFCSQYGIDLAVVDMGINGDLDDHKLLIKEKVARGTQNFTIQRAMTAEQAITAIMAGAKTFLNTYHDGGCDVVGMGEMGIGNTSSASVIISIICGKSLSQTIGRGTGLDDSGLQRKREVLEKALTLHQPDSHNGIEVLSKLGGYELAGICGAVLAASSVGCCVVLDGLISTAAGLIAYLICPDIAGYLVSGHNSVEQGQRGALQYMGLEPVLDLNFRLGEGTGAAITINLIELACKMMREMASFEEAGVESRSTQ